MVAGRRAAVLIGVSRTGGLPELRAVDSGVDLMERWARSQGFDFIERITDESGGEVHPRRIRKAIDAVVQRGDVQQLVVYFAGHGVNLGASEFWLLSEAPNDPNAAVNVAGTERLARVGTIPHVVFLSDACRTAAEGIQAQAVQGSLVYPNVQGDGGFRWVDLFYAAALGTPALELKDPNVAAGRYSALYTDALFELLSGDAPDLIEALPDDPGFGAIRLRPLRDRLPVSVVARLRKRNLDLEHSQSPAAWVTSDPEAWLSRVELPLRGRGGGTVGEVGMGRGETFESESVQDVSLEALGGMLSSGRGISEAVIRVGVPPSRGPGGGGGTAREEFAVAFSRGLETFGPDHLETECGFKVRGARVRQARARRLEAEVLDDALVRVKEGIMEPPTSPDLVLLRFADRRGVLLPAIPGFLATLTFEAGELSQVAYEPSRFSQRWEDYRQRAEELRELRSLITQSVRHGAFRLEGDDALALAERIRYAKGVDPALAVYAAYAFDSLHRRDLVEKMARYLQDDLGFVPFDVALLSGRIGESAEPLRGRPAEVLPFTPLLAQGWALLDVLGVRLPRGLEDLRQHRVPSLWTLFDEWGAERIHEHLTER